MSKTVKIKVLGGIDELKLSRSIIFGDSFMVEAKDENGNVYEFSLAVKKMKRNSETVKLEGKAGAEKGAVSITGCHCPEERKSCFYLPPENANLLKASDRSEVRH